MFYAFNSKKGILNCIHDLLKLNKKKIPDENPGFIIR